MLTGFVDSVYWESYQNQIYQRRCWQCSWNTICREEGFSTRDAKDKVFQQYLRYKFKEQRSIKVVHELIERAYVHPMTKAEEDAFRVAFVVFVVSNLLSPSAKHEYASIDYWNALQNAVSIFRYDWSEYVIVRLLDAITKLKQDVSSSIKFPNITGCSIFLQVKHLSISTA